MVLCLNRYEVLAEEDSPVIVLAYHHILYDEKTNKNPATISVENFDEQMRYLRENGYNSITLDMLNNHLKYGSSLPPKSILITFDDGYQSNYIYAYPILKKYNFTAAIFIITKNIPEETQEFTTERLSFMSMEEINISRDVFEFASHTHSLHKQSKDKKSLLTLSSKEDIAKDLQTSKNIINTKYFAYPFGQFNSTTEEALASEGFELAFTVKPGIVNRQSNRFYLNRLPVFNSTTTKDLGRILTQMSHNKNS